MPTLRILEGRYYSQADEDHFFAWLRSIPGVRRITGTEDGLSVVFGTAGPGESALRELLALHWRYRLPMKDLAQYKAPRNEGWFADPNAYWYEAVFGPQAISPDIDSRLKELHDAGATPIEAIKALHLDYSFGLAEAKRRLSLSKHWQSEARAADVLHAHVLAVLERGAKPKRRRAA